MKLDSSAPVRWWAPRAASILLATACLDPRPATRGGAFTGFEHSVAAQLVAAEPYTWNTVGMGGGGYVSGLVAHPTQANLYYARTDVGGAYRWDQATSAWVSLLDWVSEADLGGMPGASMRALRTDRARGMPGASMRALRTDRTRGTRAAAVPTHRRGMARSAPTPRRRRRTRAHPRGRMTPRGYSAARAICAEAGARAPVARGRSGRWSPSSPPAGDGGAPIDQALRRGQERAGRASRRASGVSS